MLSVELENNHTAILQVTDMKGAIRTSVSIQQSGSIVLSIDNDYSAGVYYATLISNGKVKRYPLIINKTGK